MGDTFLLCSDGLSGPVEDEEIGAILASMPPAEAVDAPVDLANLRGGPDNIPAIVVKVIGPPPTQSQAGRPGSEVGGAKPVSALVWTLLGVSILAAAGAAAVQSWAIALVCLAGAVVAAATALVQRYGGREAGSQFDGRPLGKGPYRSCNCTAGSEFLDRLDGMIEELREVATREDWKIDWSRFRTLLGQATEAREAADLEQTIRDYFRTIRFMMVQLKLQRSSDDDQGVLGQ